MNRKIIIDHTKCTGCYMCGQVCSLEKTRTFNPAASRIRLVDWENTGETVPIVCQHCAEPVCLPSCPEGAISRDVETGVVSIDPDRCTNCFMCKKVCPYGGPTFSAPEKRIVLCDLCGGEPACVIVCPTEALSYQEHDLQHPGQRLTAMEKIRETLLKKERRQ